jgi:hypothetical protein
MLGDESHGLTTQAEALTIRLATGVRPAVASRTGESWDARLRLAQTAMKEPAPGRMTGSARISWDMAAPERF